jgi:hypothetical protein
MQLLCLLLLPMLLMFVSCIISNSHLLLLLLLPPPPATAAYCRYIEMNDSSSFRLIKGKQFKLALADDSASLPDEFKVSA